MQFEIQSLDLNNPYHREAIDRLIHHATIFEIEAESYRRKEAEARLGSVLAR